MKQISFEFAIYLFNSKQEFYLLYDDGTEALCESWEDLKQHHESNSIFGVEQ